MKRHFLYLLLLLSFNSKSQSINFESDLYEFNTFRLLPISNNIFPFGNEEILGFDLEIQEIENNQENRQTINFSRINDTLFKIINFEDYRLIKVGKKINYLTKNPNSQSFSYLKRNMRNIEKLNFEIETQNDTILLKISQYFQNQSKYVWNELLIPQTDSSFYSSYEDNVYLYENYKNCESKIHFKLIEGDTSFLKYEIFYLKEKNIYIFEQFSLQGNFNQQLVLELIFENGFLHQVNESLFSIQNSEAKKFIERKYQIINLRTK